MPNSRTLEYNLTPSGGTGLSDLGQFGIKHEKYINFTFRFKYRLILFRANLFWPYFNPILATFWPGSVRLRLE